MAARKIEVEPNQPLRFQIGFKHGQSIPPFDQRGGEIDERTLTQVVGAVLESQSQLQNVRSRRCSAGHQIDEELLVDLVTGEDVREDGSTNASRLGELCKSAHVLRQARTTKSMPGLQVVRRNVELGVSQEYLRELTGVEVLRKCKSA